MTDQQRRATLAEATEDVPRENQIVLEGDGVGMSASEAEDNLVKFNVERDPQTLEKINNVSKSNEKVLYPTAEDTKTPEQKSLLNGNNPHQYPTVRESDAKITPEDGKRSIDIVKKI